MRRLKRKKSKRVLLWSGMILALLAVGTYWAMNVAVDKALHVISGNGKPALRDIDATIHSSPSHTTEAAEMKTEEAGTKQDKPAPEKEPAVSPLDGTISSSSTPQPANNEKTAVSPTPAASSYNASISTEKAQKAQEQITLQEKALVSSIFLKRFNPQELSAFMSLAGGGLTVEEKVEAKKLVMKKLSEDEYNKLITIAAKLGLSQGKNFQDSLKESATTK